MCSDSTQCRRFCSFLTTCCFAPVWLLLGFMSILVFVVVMSFLWFIIIVVVVVVVVLLEAFVERVPVTLSDRGALVRQ